MGVDYMAEAQFFGEYEVIEEIGRGGMSVVYKAKHPNLPKFVAIKVLSKFYSDDPAFIEKFRKEAEILSSFRHQNIVYIIDFRQEGNLYYIVMDYIDGYTVKQILENSGLFSLKVATNVVKSVLNALYYSHRKGIIHRDLKSSNIMIDENGKVLVTDFGLAREINVDLVRETSHQIAGTIEYMAPEQFDSKLGSISERTDIYSLGICFYEMVTGKLPFDNKSTPINIAFKHLSALPDPPRSIVPTLLPKAESIILKMLEKDPSKRYQSAEEALTDIMELEEVLKYYKEPSEEASGSYFEIAVEEPLKEEKKETPPSEKIKEDPHIGKVIGERYRIDKLLLKRIFSSLYLGADLTSGKDVTIQIPNDSRPTFKLRIEREVKALKEIDHPLFVKFLDVLEENGTSYVIREYVDGVSVRNFLRTKKPSIEESVKLILDVLEGTQFLHENGIIHRDLNSDTVILTPEGKAKITFLGLTRVEDASSVSSGEFLGVVQYTAPEQITDSRSDVRSEIYSIGILLYELLVGVPPFDSPLPVEVIDMQLKKLPRFPENAQKEIPLNLQRIVLKALSKSPDQRFQTPKEMTQELKNFLNSYLGKGEETKEGGEERNEISSIIYEDLQKSSKASRKKFSFSIRKKQEKKKEEKKDISKSIDEGLKARKVKTPALETKPLAKKTKVKRKPVKLSKSVFYLLIAIILVGVLYFGFYKQNLSSLPFNKLSSLITISLPKEKIEFSSYNPYEFNLPIKGNVPISYVKIINLPEEVIGESILNKESVKIKLYSISGKRVFPFTFSVAAYNNKKEVGRINLNAVVLNRNVKTLSFAISETKFELVSDNDLQMGNFEVKPLFYNFNLYLPLRDVVKVFGGKLDYDFQEEAITANFGKDIFKFYLLKPEYYINGEAKDDGKPIIEIDDKAYVSLIFLSQNLKSSFRFGTDKDGKMRITITYFG
jgi:serine/threonine protein kinase